ncbi:hypothetical protein TSUD_188860 [Trifolium subterraneum]|uniref:RNase H type-1 domain-containing protein n=1 Tax=Trifolium subterraneum TaxID=3900 RepID=A0A2Z6PFL3_TRISU|nr:hypothetical protein TSUD_188860 [Trifolium subterraneum]
MAANTSTRHVELQQHVVLVSWRPPPTGLVRLNTDGSCRDGGHICCGGIIKGSDAIKSHGNESWKGRSLVEKIHSLLALDWEVVIHHSYREANQCAYALANYGCSMDTRIIYFDALMNIKKRRKRNTSLLLLLLLLLLLPNSLQIQLKSFHPRSNIVHDKSRPCPTTSAFVAVDFDSRPDL